MQIKNHTQYQKKENHYHRRHEGIEGNLREEPE